ncbi:flagellar hook capping FlgD N-terminal domain-containing protein [Novosphingobium sp.]|uniref:flagellar hook capping FlgD N-terminal domain-containing protein n=1 Tax=Novosphingobium sp. TaxID=1874826 RepID=UPI0025CFAF68|nr:flagellar hook capping FlgD N-terminal domain-containing protein [Novosphingobium sp.]
MTTAVSATSSASPATTAAAPKTGFASLGAGDFIKMLSAQLQNQDPTKPSDNTAMVAQLAQFTSLSATTSMGSTLTQIAGKLDTMISELGQVIAASPPAAGPAANSTPTT